MSSLIDEGNSLLRLKKFKESIEKYEKALKTIDLPLKEKIRALSNKSQVLNILGKLDESLLVCNDVLKLSPKNTKILIKKSRILFKKKVGLILPLRELIRVKKSDFNVVKGTDVYKIIFKKISPIDLFSVLEMCCKYYKEVIFTKFQLLKIKEADHDTWMLQDYFDGSTEEKYVICPKEKFYKEKSSEYFYRFSLGNFKNSGYLNYHFVVILLKILKKNKFVYFKKKQITRVSLGIGDFKGKSIIYHHITNRGVVRKNYDYHLWIKLSLIGSNEKKEEIFIDLMSSLYFNHISFYRDLEFPIKVTKKKEEFEDNFKRIKYFEGDKLKKFCDVEYEKKILKGNKNTVYFNKFAYNLEEILKQKKILKDFSFN